MKHITLSSAEIDKIDEVIGSVPIDSYPIDPINEFEVLKRLSIYAHQLPTRLVEFILDFKYDEVEKGVSLVKGMNIDENRISHTPEHWKHYDSAYSTLKEEIFLLLCSSLLGDGFGWSSQQEGRMMHNIVPIKGDEYKQEGSSTLTDLFWHTEEAFHPFRCDYLALFCIRNEDQAITTYASACDLDLKDEEKQVLFQPHFTILPDTSHLKQENRSDGIGEMQDKPKKVPILYGDYEHPYICIDPAYTALEFENETIKQTYTKVIGEIERNLQSIVLEPGDLLLIDNCRAVHGRRSYKSTYTKNSRWLKRLNITRDLRKSRAARPDFRDRIIYT